MMLENLIKSADNGSFDADFEKLCSPDGIMAARERLKDAAAEFSGLFGNGRQVRIFSAPGRTEIGGNHTDHQHGRVLAASVDMDVLCIASPNGQDVIRIQSKGFPMDEVDISCLEPVETERNKAKSLIRGVAARLKELGFALGGFDAYTTSNVLKGSGLSSSAAFEVAVGNMISGLFNENSISPVEIAKAGQYAENVFFGKPSGLMDQMASSVGGFVAIDFKKPENPVIEKVDFDFAKSCYAMCIVDTGGSHADLTHEYAAIPQEMGDVARFLGAAHLRDANEVKFFDSIPEIRAKYGDRAVLRAMHFFAENERARLQAQALGMGNLDVFLRLVRESGSSSLVLLQNIYAGENPREQGIGLALAISEKYMGGSGAFRVHGGGIAGTIQAFIHKEAVREYTSLMEGVFGAGSCHRLAIRPVGGTEIIAAEEV